MRRRAARDARRRTARDAAAVMVRQSHGKKKPKKPKPSSGEGAVRRGSAGAGIAKRKHTHGSDERGLLKRLEAAAPAKPESSLAKKRKKRAAKSAILGAVGGMKASLDDLLEASESRAAAASGSGGGSLTSKKRQKLVADETSHMKAVLAHPAFIADPFAALQEHLQNTVSRPARER